MRYARRLVVALALLAAALVLPRPALAASAGVDMYRLYNPNSGEHFYTASTGERDSLTRAGWRYEGVGWRAPTGSNTPVYRLYSGTDHHYTTSAAERDALRRVGWRYEGVGWYSDDAKGQALYRQYNPNVNPSAPRNNSGSHNYTTSKAENDSLVRVGWRAEGVGWYGVREAPVEKAPDTLTYKDVNFLGSYSYYTPNIVQGFGRATVRNSNLVSTIKMSANGIKPYLKDLTFTATDVTPEVVARMYRELGIRGTTPTVGKPVVETVEYPHASYTYVTVTVSAGQQARYVKLVAYWRGKPVSTFYDIVSNPEVEGAFYDQVRRKVESKLWKSDMDNIQKLKALNHYIECVCHYPGTPACTKEGNPTWWREFTVDGHFNISEANNHTAELYATLVLQRGWGTCFACEVVHDAAVRDLHMKDLGTWGDGSTGSPSGEGAYVGMARFSSQGESGRGGQHASFVYQDASGNKTYIDCSPDLQCTCDRECKKSLIHLN